MRKPNIEDFDASGKVRSLNSPLDGMPKIERPQPPQTVIPPQPKRAPIVTPERAFAPTGVRSNGKRIITRNSFEIYEDQMDSLRELSFQDKRQGKLGSMSAMVRDAIDEYLKRNRIKA